MTGSDRMQRNRATRLAGAVAAVVAIMLGWPGLARAGFSVSSGNLPSPDIILYYNQPGGSSVIGRSNNPPVPLLAEFTSNKNIATGGNGQAYIQAVNGLLSTLTMTFLNDWAASAVDFNPQTANGLTGQIEITVNQGWSDWVTFSPFNIDNGENRWLVQGLNGSLIRNLTWTVISSNTNTMAIVDKVKQYRFEGLQDPVGPETAPEPATVASALLAAGMLGGRSIWRRRRP